MTSPHKKILTVFFYDAGITLFYYFIIFLFWIFWIFMFVILNKNYFHNNIYNI